MFDILYRPIPNQDTANKPYKNYAVIGKLQDNYLKIHQNICLTEEYKMPLKSLLGIY